MTEKAVLVLPVEAEHVEKITKAMQVGLRAAYDSDGQQPWGPLQMAVGPDMEMVLDVFREPKPGGGRHVLRVDNERWHLEHSLVCRRAGLENCPINTMVSVGMDTEAFWDIGEHELRLDSSGVLLWGDDL